MDMPQWNRYLTRAELSWWATQRNFDGSYFDRLCLYVLVSLADALQAKYFDSTLVTPGRVFLELKKLEGMEPEFFELSEFEDYDAFMVASSLERNNGVVFQSETHSDSLIVKYHFTDALIQDRAYPFLDAMYAQGDEWLHSLVENDELLEAPHQRPLAGGFDALETAKYPERRNMKRRYGISVIKPKK